MKKLRIQGTEDGTFDQEYDDQIDEDNGATDRQHGSDFKTNRSKIKQRKQAYRTNSKVKRSIFKETVSTKVKKQEKFHLHLENE